MVTAVRHPRSLEAPADSGPPADPVFRSRPVWWPPLIMLLIGLVATAGLTWQTQRNLVHARDAEFVRRMEDTRNAIEGRLKSYTEVLYGMRARFTAAPPVTRADFHEYVTLSDVLDRNPGAQALSFVRLVHSDDRASYEAGVQHDTSLGPDGYPSFAVHPSSPGPDLFVVDSIEPIAGNEAALGFDTGADPGRRAAIEEARDTAEVVASGPVRLVQEQGNQSGFLLFLAVYHGPAIPATAPARRRSLIGFVDVVFRVGDMMGGVLGAQPSVRTEIYDLGPTVDRPRLPIEDGLLFDADTRHQALDGAGGEPSGPADGGPRGFVDMNVAGRRWRVFATPVVPLQSSAAEALPWTRALGGVTISLLLAGLIYAFARSRRVAETFALEATATLRERGIELETANADLKAINEAMRDFVAIASHDLRSPLTSVVGFARLLTDNWDQISEAERREFVATIDRQGRHLSRLVDDLLTLSSIEGGSLDTRPEPIDLGDAIGRCLSASGQEVAEVSVSCPDDLIVHVDGGHLDRILGNYLGNALKYGEPPVRVDATRDGDAVEVRVSDHGPGVPTEFLSKLFAKFARADTPKTRTEKGTGLGLSIVRGLAEANGGQASYEALSPRGACFVVRLRAAGGAVE